MQIRIDPHTLARAAERGVSLSEITQTIETGNAMSAQPGRLARYKLFDFNRFRNGRYFKQKRVEVVFVTANDVIITVTVYAMYGWWEVLE